MEAATALADACGDLPLTLDLPGADEARRDAAAARRQLHDYVIPRLRDADAPLLAVVGGSTGAGKSTIVNSLVGAEVSKAGVLRPTTRSPVLVHHPDAVPWFEGDRILGSLARVRGGAATTAGELELVADPAVPETIAILDAPDVDSVVDANRNLAAQLLSAADLWIFVTTAARYADAVPWTFLDSAATRGVHVAIVLNRVPAGAGDNVGGHLADMLQAGGLGAASVFTIEEQPLTDGRIPQAAMTPLHQWLGGLASDQQARAEVVHRSLAGTVAELAATANRLADAIERQVEAVTWLARRAGESFDRARKLIGDDIRGGTVMRGEVLARWQDLVGTGKLVEQLQSTIGRVRDRLTAALTGKPQPTDRFRGAVSHGVELVVRERVAQAIDETIGHWRRQPAGEALLAESRRGGVDLTQPAEALDGRIERAVRDWQGAVVDLLRSQGAGKRRAARALSYGINGLAAVLMVGVFAQTGGLTGAEVAIAGGSSAVGQRLLQALLGDQAVRNLTVQARNDLDRRIDEQLLAPEAQRFTDAVAAHRVDGIARELRQLGRDLSTAVHE